MHRSTIISLVLLFPENQEYFMNKQFSKEKCHPFSVGFVGFGKSNKGVYKYFKKHFPNTKFTLRAKSAPSNTEFFDRVMSGKQEFLNISEDILFLSPSVRRDITELSALSHTKAQLSSDAEYFFQNTDSDVFAVTGSDGKSTTTTLTSLMLTCGYENAIPAGNIGVPLTPLLDLPNSDAIVTELSSFQLMYLKPKSRRCVITNITENHLNWHKSFDEYISAKSNILDRTDEIIINFDCHISRKLIKNRNVFAVFSTAASEKELRDSVKAEIYITKKNSDIILSGDVAMSTDKMIIKGEHNVKNFMAAIAMSHGFCSRDEREAIASSFGGLPHRCEYVCTANGVNFINSSIDSSPKRTVATLAMLSEKTVLILGGQSKGLDYSELILSLGENIRNIVITGENRNEILNSINFLRPELIPITLCVDGFYDAIDAAIKKALPGDTVILSPASTSFDSFSNFEERGNAFKEYVKRCTGI